MRLLTETETMKIVGGFKKSFIFSAAAIVTFLIGLIDGYVRPLKCNN